MDRKAPAYQWTENDVRRFWGKVRESNGCLIWTGAKRDDNYGCFTIRRLSIAAHRFAFAITHGRIPDGLLICHRCDTPLCVNPDHLFAGTHSENMRDKVAKGRGNFRSGEQHQNSVLRDAQRAEIRARSAYGESQASLARRFKVSPMTVSRAIRAVTP